MSLFEPAPEADVRIVLRAVAYLPNAGMTRRHLETLNGVSYAPGSRFGTALDTAIAQGLVRVDGDRYHLTEQGADQ